MGKYCDTKQLESIWGSWIRTRSTPELEQLRALGLLWYNLSVNHYCVAQQHCYCLLSYDTFCADNKFDQTIAARLKDDNYQLDLPCAEYWRQLSRSIYKMCLGLSLKFNPSDEDERLDLANEALLQTLTKMEHNKLVYIPGKAPVFNLLTTAIIRIMFSIKNKEKRQRVNQAKFINAMISGAAMPQSRSLIVARSEITSRKFDNNWYSDAVKIC